MILLFSFLKIKKEKNDSILLFIIGYKKEDTYYLSHDDIFSCPNLNLPMSFFQYSIMYHNEKNKPYKPIFYCENQQDGHNRVKKILIESCFWGNDFEHVFDCLCVYPRSNKCDICHIKTSYDEQKRVQFPSDKLKQLPLDVILRLYSNSDPMDFDLKENYIFMKYNKIRICITGIKLPYFASYEKVIECINQKY
jgi:hypothetical protein